MRTGAILLLLALVSVSLAGIEHLSAADILSMTPNPNDIVKQVQFNPLNWAEPEIEVSITQIEVGWHGHAYRQYLALFPHFHGFPIRRCRYAALGPLRYYTFNVDVQGEIEEAKTTIRIDIKPKEAPQSEDAKDGFMQISTAWARQDPTVSFALDQVVKRYWDMILGNPLLAAWQKPIDGVWVFRFYFRGSKKPFEWTLEESITEGDDNYFGRREPMYSLALPKSYKPFNVLALKKTPYYSFIVDQLTAQLGRFEEKWLMDVQITTNHQDGAAYIRITINFVPFLIKCDFEAHYYGNAEKAALLKIDERVFNGNGKSFEDWQEIEEFNSYHAFREANEYAHSQFTWLRFYNVVSAYSALHKRGRFVRLVYQGNADYVDGGNQINIVIFIDEKGCYYINRNDFLATHLNSYGRNDWVSLFVSTPDMTKAEYYQHIVKFYKEIYPKFWSTNQLVDIKFKDDLHVIKFKNPTNLDFYSVLAITDEGIKVRNKFYWVRLGDESPLFGRLERYVRARYSEIHKIMFVQHLSSDNGTHFEVSYLDKEGGYGTCNVLYIRETDVFAEDTVFFAEEEEYDEHEYIDPLPKDIKESIVKYLSKAEDKLRAVVSYEALSIRNYVVVGLVGSRRWHYDLKWRHSNWMVVSRKPIGDGYFLASGYPTSLAASCTGFVNRLYHHNFLNGFVYVTIETKSVGVDLFHRIVYDLNGDAFEAVVQSTFGVAYSHVLVSWNPLLFFRPARDYGYGRVYSVKTYGLDNNLLYVSPKDIVSKHHLTMDHDACKEG